MKSLSYYSRKAAACVELGQWTAAKDWQAKAAKARRIAKRKKAAAPGMEPPRALVTVPALQSAKR